MQISVLDDVISTWPTLPVSGSQAEEGEFDRAMSLETALLKDLPPGLTRSCPGRGNPPAGAPSRLNLPEQAFLPGIWGELTAAKGQAAGPGEPQQAGDDDAEGDTGKDQDPLAVLLISPDLMQNAARVKEGTVPGEAQTPTAGASQPDESTSATSTVEEEHSIYLARPVVKMLERNRIEMLQETLPNNTLKDAQPGKNSGPLEAETVKDIQKENAVGAGKTVRPAESALVEGGHRQPQVKPLVQPGETTPAGLKSGLAAQKGGKQGEKVNSVKISVSGFFRMAGETENKHAKDADMAKSSTVTPGIAKRYATAVKDGPPVSLTGSEGKPAEQSGSPLTNSIVSEPPPAGSTKGVALADLPGRLVQEFKQVASTRKDKLRTEIELKLEPEHLGKLMVKLFINKGVLSVHFFTGNSNVKEALEASLQQLKESLVQHDLKLNEAFVFVGDGNRGNAGSYFDRGNSKPAYHGFDNWQAAENYHAETNSFSPERASGGVNCLI